MPETNRATTSEAEPPPARATVVLAVVATLLLGGGALFILVHRAITTPAPERQLVIRGSSDWEGAELVVTGDDAAPPIRALVQQSGSYVVPFFLAPGKYHLSVKSQGVEVWQQDFDLRVIDEQELDLTRTGATTRPATAPSNTNS